MAATRASRASGRGRRNFLRTSAGASAGLMMSALNVRRVFGQTAPQQPIARPWTLAPKGPVSPVSCDTHTHWAPVGYIKALAEMGNLGDNPVNADMDKRRQWMDVHGVKTLVLSLSGGMPWDWVSPEEAAHLSQIINDAGIEAHQAFPDRFVTAVELPVSDPALALKELNRVAGKPGVRGVHLPNTVGGRDFLFEPAYEPLLARCEALGYPLVFHALNEVIDLFGGAQTRVGDPIAVAGFLNNWVSFTSDTTTTAAKFIVSGTLDKFPRLEIVLPHAGGSFPGVVGRLEYSLAQSKFKLQRSFKEYIRRFHYDSLTYYPETMEYLISLVGADRIVIGTDNGFSPNNAIEWPNSIVEQLNLPAKDRDLILWGNAARLFHLKRL